MAAGLFCAALLAITAKNNDPVLMNVGGHDVPLSEFEYLFHKNNSQQAQPQTIDEYVDMFVDYKLKVADAEAVGVDTTKAFREEFEKFRNDLSDPYLTDNSVADSLVNLIYQRMGEEVTVSHIMMGQDMAEALETLRQAIVDGQVSFENAARKNSMDKPSARQGGLMGIVTPGRFPYAFEDMAYTTAVGEISPVFDSGFGQHIIRVERRQPSRGEVNASHILRLTQGKDSVELVAQKALIDSIYEVVKADPSKFETLAKQLSEDPGSARKGGALGWFGSGMMVAEFDSVAYAIPVGEISKPFQTSFGWHIIKKDDARTLGSFEETTDKIKQMIERGNRRDLPQQTFINRLMKKYNASVNDRLSDDVKNMCRESSQVLDSALIAQLKNSDVPAFIIGSQSTTLGEVMADVPQLMPVEGENNIVRLVSDLVKNELDQRLLAAAREDLYVENPDYRNLVNEYRDGILLFEISNRNVWDRASKDKEGLEKFFNANRAKYTWDAPKFKSYIIFANSDSLLNEAMDYANSLPADLVPTDFVKQMRDKFGRDIKVERVIAAKGENAITDYLAFGGDKPEPSSANNRWKFYKAFRGQVIDAPQEAADVRGAVVSDYQNALEKEWIEQLHKNYKVKINKKVLKQVK